MKCRICDSDSQFFATALLLKQHNINYYKCNYCGFIQTEKPYWLKEAYLEVINDFDVGLVNRNVQNSLVLKVLITYLFDADAKFIDYGGGYGLFVRLMRDLGFNFYLYEPYCSNMFAKGFEYDKDAFIKKSFELLTAFELFEHLEDPLIDIENMFSFSSNIMFTTLLIPTSNPKPIEWWYYGVEHGQHISFYTKKSLNIVADKFNTNLYSDGVQFHLFAKQRISNKAFIILSKNRISRLLSSIIKRKSLIESDYNRVLTKFRLS